MQIFLIKKGRDFTSVPYDQLAKNNDDVLN